VPIVSIVITGLGLSRQLRFASRMRPAGIPADPGTGQHLGGRRRGVTTKGCNYASRSVASYGCKISPQNWRYWTAGLYTVRWDDDTSTDPVPRYSTATTSRYLC
jgi:hypothetical protein